MADLPTVPLPGSDRSALTSVEPLGPVPPDESVELTIVLRRRAEIPADVLGGSRQLQRAELAAGYGADPQDVERVRAALTAAGLQITAEDPASRRIGVSGPASAVSAAFGAELTRVRHPEGHEHRHRSGELHVPADLDGVIVAVLGADDRPQARTLNRIHSGSGGSSYTAPQLGDVYGFPAGTDGTDQTIAILELGGGYTDQDLNSYFGGINTDVPTVTAVEVDGAKNDPGADSNTDTEVALDIEIAGALAPKAALVVYFAPNTDKGFLDALSQAAHADPTPAAISISWGQSEDQWTAQARTAMDQAIADAVALGTTVCSASGDAGSADNQSDGKAHVDFPASSPNSLGCGGTSLVLDSSGAVTSEQVWNGGTNGGATGGGVSDVFDQPSWQSGAGIPQRSGGGTGRGVPDVAANADPATGYQVVVGGQQVVVGGTSAVAPLWAALIARLDQALGSKLGAATGRFYSGVTAGNAAAGFRDITSGDNGDYQAGPGWDACTGLGVPDGTALLDRLNNSGSAVG
ncbi:MAG TPA: S53 family peptidase [Mycobacteriales bacterium]|nr:S53 family peptidase [Mycobacteriales bacterium]